MNILTVKEIKSILADLMVGNVTAAKSVMAGIRRIVSSVAARQSRDPSMETPDYGRMRVVWNEHVSLLSESPVMCAICVVLTKQFGVNMSTYYQSAQQVDPVWASQQLKWWFSLAEINDTYGVPVDLIFVFCRDRNALPQIYRKNADKYGNEFAYLTHVTSDEFEEGIAFCKKVLQAGGWERLRNFLIGEPGG